MPRLTPAIVVRALRLPFTGASLLPFLVGSLHAGRPLRLGILAGGAAAVVANHLAANLLNDYADSRSGADWKDRRFFGLFGGSKLIQEGVLPERFYLLTSLLLFAVAFAIVAALARAMHSPDVLLLYLAVLALSAAYSARPLQLAYRRLGEIVIFVLFGPALVMGGTTFQLGVFPEWTSLWLSLPFGFLTAAILVANEVPDHPADAAAGKRNLVGWVGPANAWRLYAGLIAGGFGALAFAIAAGILTPWAAAAFLLVPLAARAADVLYRHPADPQRLLESSKLTILCQTLFSLILLAERIAWCFWLAPRAAGLAPLP
jgi:1,4-dihydroxy-2-naphthoate octaprenyltransferase